MEAHKDVITSLILIKSRNEIATGSIDSTIKIWIININKKNLLLNKEIKAHDNSVLSLKDFPKLKVFCSTSSDKTVKLWDNESLDCISTLFYHTNSVITSCYNPSGGKEIFTGGEDLLIVIWKPIGNNNYKMKSALKGHKKRISALIFV